MLSNTKNQLMYTEYQIKRSGKILIPNPVANIGSLIPTECTLQESVLVIIVSDNLTSK